MFKWPQHSHVDKQIKRCCKVLYRKCCHDLKQKEHTNYATIDDHHENPPKEVDPEQWK